MHKTQEVREAAERFGILLLYNAAYSSELNPVEYLWKLAKDHFRANILQTPFKPQKRVTDLVEASIRQAKAETLAKWNLKVFD